MSENTEAQVRAECRAWLEANWNPEYGLVEWRTKLIESGWGAPHWPKAWYGRDLSTGLVPVVEEEFQRIGAVGVAKAGIRVLAAATILAHGTDMHKEKFLRRILTGEDTWCQLFSEPGSGSDVAGAVTVTSHENFRSPRALVRLINGLRLADLTGQSPTIIAYARLCTFIALRCVTLQNTLRCIALPCV